jgi:hypothetical protein
MQALTTTTGVQSQNQISGKVMLTGPTIGIPDLLVVAYDVDPATKPEELLEQFEAGSVVSRSELGAIGDRIGSVLTSSDGTFSLAYTDSEFRVRNNQEKRPDLLLLVLAPESRGKSVKEMLLFVSPEIRLNAGRLESYVVLITSEMLKAAGIAPPTEASPATDDTGDAELASLEGRLKGAKTFSDKKAAMLRQHVDIEHAQYVRQRESTFTANVRAELSKLPEAVRAGDKFVKPGESVLTKALNNTRAQVAAAFNDPPFAQKATATGHVFLTQAQIEDFQQYVQGDEYVLPAPVVEQQVVPQLFGGGNTGGSANDFLMDRPAVRTCMRSIRGDINCEGRIHGPDGTHVVTAPAPPPPEADPPNAKPEDISLYIARQMTHLNSPEGVVNFGVDGKDRPTLEEVGNHITGLRLEKGPADSTAYYDFHSLQIAFDHVWKEAIDQGIIAQGEALYDHAVAVGSAPTNLRGLLANISSTVRFIKAEPAQQQPVPPVQVIFEFPEAVDLWSAMSTNEQRALIRLTDIMLGKYRDYSGSNTTWRDYLNGLSTDVPYVDKGHLLDRSGLEVISAFRTKGQKLLDAVTERVERNEQVRTDLDGYAAADRLANELNANLQHPYSFTYYAADEVERSVNFGVLLTYQQEWRPVGYQAGELVRTIPLAPKESRKYTKRTLIKKSRSEKEVEDNVRITKSETADTSRAESEIVSKAQNKTSFSTNSKTSFDVTIEAMKMGASTDMTMSADAQRESNQTKKDFREAVLKASQEYKSERRVEISTESSSEAENTESGEISNPNDELTVTYLFYELQRQFRVNERLYRMRPVVLVAQEMPAPHEIDDEWIVRYEWILKRVLLDDGFKYAFECVISVRGDRLMLAELERTVLEQRKIVRDLRQNVRFYTDESGRLSRLMQAAINKQAAAAEDRDFWDGIPLLGKQLDAVEGAVKGVSNMLGMGSGDDPKEAARIRREGIKDSYERADRERRELMGRLEHETDVLNGLTKEVAQKRKEINEKDILLAQLRNHLKDNILHYMQAIWSYEHPDQRFFRLFNTKVPQLSAPAANYNLRIKTAPAPSVPLEAVANLDLTGSARKVRHPFYCRPVIQVEEKTLAEVAELDNLLGFKGNYMIFPLRKSNVLTDFMMAPYVDTEFGLLDPDAPGNWSLDEFEQLYCCLKEQMGDAFATIEPQLKEFYKQLLMDPLRPGDLVTVPTGSLFIEALPGEHPVLENFKALHRAVDVKKAQAEVRRLELENIRYAARILGEKLEDPEIEKRVIIQGSGSPVVET